MLLDSFSFSPYLILTYNSLSFFPSFLIINSFFSHLTVGLISFQLLDHFVLRKTSTSCCTTNGCVAIDLTSSVLSVLFLKFLNPQYQRSSLIPI
jgi:hypothetical protein